MKSIDWNRVMIAWALGSLAVLGGAHLANAESWSVSTIDNAHYPTEHVLITDQPVHQ